MRKYLFLIMLVAVSGCTQHHIVQRDLRPDQIHHLSAFKHLKEIQALNHQVGYLDEGDIVPLKLTLESEWLGIRQDHVDLVAKKRIYFSLTVPDDVSKDRLEKILNLDQQQLSVMTDAERAELFKGVMLYLSNDAVHWAPLSDMPAIKDVFAIKGGTLSLGMGMDPVSVDETEGAWIALSIIAIKKE